MTQARLSLDSRTVCDQCCQRDGVARPGGKRGMSSSAYPTEAFLADHGWNPGCRGTSILLGTRQVLVLGLIEDEAFSMQNSHVGEREDAECQPLALGSPSRAEVMLNTCSPCAAGPALSALMGLLSYLGWGWAAALRKVSLFVSKVMPPRKFLMAAAKFPVASGCQMLHRLY